MKTYAIVKRFFAGVNDYNYLTDTGEQYGALGRKLAKRFTLNVAMKMVDKKNSPRSGWDSGAGAWSLEVVKGD